jgi:anthranilate phosphoribosyltransferase
MIKEAIGKLIKKQDLSRLEAGTVMTEIMEGQATTAQLGSFLTALNMKGETGDEIAGMAESMRAKALQVTTDGPALDIVGTGGDGLNTFNISTAAALVAAGAGVRIAKHGNRAATGKCGAADVLEKLGVKIDLTPEQVTDCIRQTGIGFMFAMTFHPAMKYAAGTRREIGVRTVFNILGPLTNPARAEYQVLGVSNPGMAVKIVSALSQMGLRHALVVYGLNGMDELSISGPSVYYEIKGQLAKKNEITPEGLGLKSWPLESIQGGTSDENAVLIRQVLQGIKGPHRDAVILNAAAGLLAAERVDSLQDGVTMAGKVIDSGKAASKLKEMAEFTQRIIGILA